jgi:hypothetical protein
MIEYFFAKEKLSWFVPSFQQGDDFVSNRFYLSLSGSGFAVLNFTSSFTARAVTDSSSSSSYSGHSHLAPGVVAAICIAAVVTAVVVIGAAVFVTYKRRQAAADASVYQTM